MVFLSTSEGSWGVLRRNTLQVQGSGLTLIDLARSNDGQMFGINFSNLYKLRRSGSPVLLGSLGVSDSINGLAFDDRNRLHGTSDSGGFYRISTQTGQASLITSIPNFVSSGDLVYQSSRRRFLATAETSGFDDLFAINRKGTATRIGSTGYYDIFGLAFKRDRLLGYTDQNQEIEINIQTGSGTFRQTINLNAGVTYGAT